MGQTLTKINLNKRLNLRSSKYFHLGLATETVVKKLKRKDFVDGNDVKMFHELIMICVTAAASKGVLSNFLLDALQAFFNLLNYDN